MCSKEVEGVEEVGSPRFTWLPKSGKKSQGGGDVEHSHFKPSAEEELVRLSWKSFAESTERKILWGVDLFHEWRFSHLTKDYCPTEILYGDIDSLNVSKADLAYSVCAFLNEVKRKDGAEFGGKGLYQLVLMLQFYLEKRGLMWKLIEDDEFSTVKFTLDNLMKAHCADRTSVTNSVKSIGFSEEDKMWQSNVLGEDEPAKLRDTVMFLIGLTCALRGGQEHQDLRCPGHDSQFSVEEDSVTGGKVLVYKADEKSKTNQGGLSGWRQKAKVVRVPSNPNFDRDLVCLFQKYCCLLPHQTKCSALYRYPLSPKNATPSTWYTEKPLGVNALKKIVSNLTGKAGLVGKYSNHSLRVSAATQMYEQGIDEQTIKEITGHKSDSVRSYKHVNKELLKHAGLSIMNPGVAAEIGEKHAEHEQSSTELTVSKAHKAKYLLRGKDGICPPACALLKKVDEKCTERKVKKVKLSLKYCKK